MPLLPYEPEVKLVALTVPTCEELEACTAEDLMVYTARVSNPNNQLNLETGSKLLNYCAKHKHWSVFEMSDMVVEIKTSRAIAAQAIRHKSMSVQEFSTRYAESQVIYLPELRVPHPKNRQLSLTPDEAKQKELWALDEKIVKHMKQTEELYNELLEAGVAKECARAVLPLNTQTTLYMKGSIRSWIHYLTVRCGNGTQKEHQDVAFAILDIFKEEFPVVYEAIKSDIPTREEG